MRDDLADTNQFLNWTTLYSDCVIGMDLNNGKGTFADKVKSIVSIGYVHENVIIDFIFVAATATIDFEHLCGQDQVYCLDRVHSRSTFTKT